MAPVRYAYTHPLCAEGLIKTFMHTKGYITYCAQVSLCSFLAMVILGPRIGNSIDVHLRFFCVSETVKQLMSCY